MLMNLTDVFLTEGKVVDMKYEWPYDSYEYMGQEFLIIEKHPIILQFIHEGQGKVLIEGIFHMVFSMNCDRCLKEIEERITFSFHKIVYSKDVRDEIDGDCEILEDYSVDIEELICNEILINWPSKVLCKEDCKGICNACGKNLNDGQCECDTFVPDPRMAVIKDIFNANKEV